MTVRRNLIPIVCNFSWFSIFYTLQPETFKTNVRIFSGKFFEKEKLSPTFASSNDIEPWCNGNTTDSGPVIPGSNPGGSTRGKQICFPFFFLRIFLHRPPCEKPGPVCGRFERRTVRRPAPPGFRKSRTAFARRTNLSAFRTVFRSASATPPFVQRHETARSVPPNHSLLPRPERRTEARGASNRISASLRHARNENAEPADAPVIRPDAPPAPQQKPARAVKRPRKIEVRPFEKPCGTGRTFRAPDRWFRVIRRPAAFEVLRSRAKPHADRHPQQKSMRLSDCRPPPKGRQPAVGIAGRHRASGGERAIPAGPASADCPKTNGASCRPDALRGDSLQAVIRRHRPDRQ